MNFKNIFIGTTAILLLSFNNIQAAGDDPNRILERYLAPVWWITAATDGHLEIMQELLDKDILDVNITDKDGNTALSLASQKGHESIVKFLLQDTRIKINVQNNLGETALNRAVSQFHENIVKLLLQVPNIDVNIKNNEGWTSLMIAVEGWTNFDPWDSGYDSERSERRNNIIRYLLEFPGINLSAQVYDNTALMWSKLRNDYVISVLIQQRINELTSEALNIISHIANSATDAERQTKIKVLKSIIAQIAADEIQDECYTKLVDKAFSINSLEIAQLLLHMAKDPQELLARFPFDAISPTTDLFKFCMDLAYGSQVAKLDDSSQICANCLKQDCIATCGACRHIYYCSLECQKQHWAVHKHYCKLS